MSTHPILQTAHLVIFDKDGTLLDFHAMWGRWIRELALRLERASGTLIADRLFHAVGFDPLLGKIDPEGVLALATMAEAHDFVAELLRDVGSSEAAVADVMAAAWVVPNPVMYARPLADLPALFGALRSQGCKIAIATIDDRAPTAATLAALELIPLVDAMACADDGFLLKPAPDAVFMLCQQLGVSPERTVVVGDSASDLRMGRAAGVGVVIGVRSGIGTDEILAPLADLLIDSVAELYH